MHNVFVARWYSGSQPTIVGISGDTLLIIIPSRAMRPRIPGWRYNLLFDAAAAAAAAAAADLENASAEIFELTNARRDVQ